MTIENIYIPEFGKKSLNQPERSAFYEEHPDDRFKDILDKNNLNLKESHEKSTDSNKTGNQSREESREFETKPVYDSPIKDNHIEERTASKEKWNRKGNEFI